MSIFITADKLIIDFPLLNSPSRSIKNTILGAATGGAISVENSGVITVRALDRINFMIRSGERVALMGHNGSGKSTLLRTIVGVYEPVSGQLLKNGRIASLIDLTLGMDADATGRENIFLRASLMGLSKEEIKFKIPEIIEFCELGNFIDLPMRTYSTGMALRLAFAISTCSDTDILVMDEWLSVGDKNFSEKASYRLNELMKQAKILVLATHSEALATSICNRIITLESGTIKSDKQL